MSLEFYAGDRDAIVDSIRGFFEGDDGDDWQNLALAKADFSIHLTTTDLGILTDVLLDRHDGAEPYDDDTRPDIFSDVIENLLESPDEDYGVHEMSPECVAAIAEVSDAKVQTLSKEWFKRVEAEPGGDVGPPTPEAVQAVHDLLKVCRTAVAKSVPVIFYWNL